MTSTPSTSTRPARSQSACSIGSRAKASAALEMSVPYSRAIHSSGHKRSAGSSRSSALARVVFPEQGSPQIRCSVAVMFPPKVSCRAMKPPNGGVDAAARIKAPFAAPSKLREALPPLASNDLRPPFGFTALFAYAQRAEQANDFVSAFCPDKDDMLFRVLVSLHENALTSVLFHYFQ